MPAPQGWWLIEWDRRLAPWLVQGSWPGAWQYYYFHFWKAETILSSIKGILLHANNSLVGMSSKYKRHLCLFIILKYILYLTKGAMMLPGMMMPMPVAPEMGTSQAPLQTVRRVRSFFPETWLWTNASSGLLKFLFDSRSIAVSAYNTVQVAFVLC